MNCSLKPSGKNCIDADCELEVVHLDRYFHFFSF
uniref:Uncharacterized protein n=1 Tax=Arundo donax TaxID=35708 RepID=A0A0A8XSD5_ARUDO